MYTAKVKNKEEVSGQIKVTVDFSDGTNTFTESVVPGDKTGFYHWVNTRLKSFNDSIELQSELTENAEVVPPTPDPEPNPDQAELDKRAWFADQQKLKVIKSELIDLGIVPETNPKIVALRDSLKANFKAEYFSL